MNELERPVARILVAVSATVETRVELDVYRYLLGDAPPEIVGLIVEDPALLAHAGSRLAREIVLSGRERRLDAEALERELRARGAAWRRRLEADSARLGMTIALETIREERRAALAQAAARAEALVVETASLREALDVWSALPSGAPLRMLVLTPGRRLAGDVVVVAEETERTGGGDSALAAAVRIARRTGARLVVLDAARQPDAREALARQTGALGVRLADYASLAGAPVDAGTLAAHAAHAGLLVLPAASSRDAKLVAGLAARIRGALMLIRGKDRPDEDVGR